MKLAMVVRAITAGVAAFAVALPTDNIDSVGITPRNEFNISAPQLGINCRGSGVCPICGPSIKSVKWYIDKIGDDTLYSNGQQIACVRCPAGGPLGGEQGICVFTQKMGDRKIKGSVVKSKINDLIRHGCDGCGSCPVDPGNNVDNGEVTVNYVSSACGTRVC